AIAISVSKLIANRIDDISSIASVSQRRPVFTCSPDVLANALLLIVSSSKQRGRQPPPPSLNLTFCYRLLQACNIVRYGLDFLIRPALGNCCHRRTSTAASGAEGGQLRCRVVLVLTAHAGELRR